MSGIYQSNIASNSQSPLFCPHQLSVLFLLPPLLASFFPIRLPHPQPLLPTHTHQQYTKTGTLREKNQQIPQAQPKEGQTRQGREKTLLQRGEENTCRYKRNLNLKHCIENMRKYQLNYKTLDSTIAIWQEEQQNKQDEKYLVLNFNHELG